MSETENNGHLNHFVTVVSLDLVPENIVLVHASCVSCAQAAITRLVHVFVFSCSQESTTRLQSCFVIMSNVKRQAMLECAIAVKKNLDTPGFRRNEVMPSWLRTEAYATAQRVVAERRGRVKMTI